MKICLLICGLKRCYEEVKLSLHENIINVLLNDGHEIDSFVHSDQDIQDIYNLKGIIISNSEIPIKKNLDITIPYQICRFNECYYNLVLPFMNENNITYEFFIVTRPDNFYFKNCLMKKINEWDINKINIRMRFYPKKMNLEYHTGYLSKRKGDEVVDDQFFIIPKKIANIAFSIKYGNFPILVKGSFNEHKLTKLWNSNNLKFNLFPINVMIHNWRFDENKKIYRKRKIIESWQEEEKK